MNFDDVIKWEQDIFVKAMSDLYPYELNGKSEKEIIDHCYDLVHPFKDHIFFEFATWCLCPDKEPPLEFMKDIISRYQDLEYGDSEYW